MIATCAQNNQLLRAKKKKNGIVCLHPAHPDPRWYLRVKSERQTGQG